MRVSMMRVRTVGMRVDLGRVVVNMTVLAVEGRTMQMVMMAVVVTMSVLMLEFVVGVEMLVPLGKV